MAGDWIPYYIDTSRKSEVLQVARISGRNRHEVVGLLLEFWGWCQRETRDRLLQRLTVDDVVEAVGGDIPFWHAVEQVGWVTFTTEGIEIPNADEWLAKGAKARLLASQRQQRWRAGRGKTVDDSVDAPPSTTASTTVQDSREKKSKQKKAAKAVVSTKFVSPTVQEVAAYVTEHTIAKQAAGERWPLRKFDAEAFVDHYESNGWKVSRNPMKCWKAAVRTWGKRDFGDNKQMQPDTARRIT